MDDDARLLAEQIAYYRARAQEYDEWFLREGRYDRGPDHRAEWFREVSVVESDLHAAALQGGIIELACGTGLWTRHLRGPHVHVLAIDSSMEALRANRRRVGSSQVSHVAADVFSLPFTKTFDAVFFSFWLSHVPQARFEQFWATISASLRPGGRAFFVDSLREQTSTAIDHGPLDDSGVARRHLNDGREFQVVKVFHEPAALEDRLRNLGWSGWVRASGKFFLYGLLSKQR
jgi:demethylmenaquinone methyltransferase/2-methoxy-6-polyprenyl-1,4-benzoquinol methylase